MANMVAGERKFNLLKQQQQLEEGVDRLSHLTDDLLISILSLMPTCYATHTSLLSHRFRHLWKACSIISFTLRGKSDLMPAKFTTKFTPMLLNAINNHDPSIPLLELYINCGVVNFYENHAVISSLVKANCLGLRSLTINPPCNSVLNMFPVIFTLSSLESLSIPFLVAYPTTMHHTTVALPHLRSLSVGFTYIENIELSQLISKLSVLENLDLGMNKCDGSFNLSSQTIKNLRLKFRSKVGLSLNLPALQLLQLECRGPYNSIPQLEINLPLLKKGILSIYNLDKGDVSAVTGLLHRLSHIEELHLLLAESWPIEKMPYHVLLDPGKDVPLFPNLKYLKVTTCFHELNCKDIVSLVNNSPILRSLKLFHQAMLWLTEDKKVRNSWRSELPCSHNEDYGYSNFTNLHLEDNRKKFLELFNTKPDIKRLIMSYLGILCLYFLP